MDGPLSILESWKNFLPEGAVVMAKRGRILERANLADSVPTSADVKNYKILFQAPDLGAAGARDLFDKIIAALDLKAEEFAVIEGKEIPYSSAVLVRFLLGEQEAMGAWQKEPTDRTGAVDSLTTYSLSSMLTSPALKKPVWAQLKEAVARARQASENRSEN